MIRDVLIGNIGVITNCMIIFKVNIDLILTPHPALSKCEKGKDSL